VALISLSDVASSNPLEVAIQSCSTTPKSSPCSALEEESDHPSNSKRIVSIDLYSLDGLFSLCRPRDDTLANSCFQSFK